MTTPEVRALAASPAETVLDVGCGVGTTAIRLARAYGAEVVAADNSPLMSDRALKNGSAAGTQARVRIEPADVEALPYADEGAGTPLIFGRAMTRPAYLRRMSWLMPRLLRVAPYIGYVLISASKPGVRVGEAS